MAELAVERIRLGYPGLAARGEACMGRTRDGDVWAAVGFNTGRPGSGPPTGPERLFHSADGGRTWESRPLTPTNGGRMCAFTVLADDTMLLAVAGSDRLLGAELRVYRSRDRGAGWDGPALIHAAPYEHIGGGFVSMTQTASGAVVLPVSRQSGDQESGGKHDNVVFRSVDGGLTWGDPSPTFVHASEPHVIQLRAGRLLGAFRHQRPALKDDPPDLVESYGAKPARVTSGVPGQGDTIFKHVFVGDSHDDGRTWTDLRPLRTKAGLPLLQFGECHGQLVQLPDGAVVLVHDRRYPYEESEIRARVSRDDGRTWEPEVYHLTRGMGYPASVALEDGAIVTVTGSTRIDSRAVPLAEWTVHAIRWRPA